MHQEDVVYEVREGVPGRYFRCDRYGLMSDDSCGRNFIAAPKLAAEGRLSGCVGCNVGAQHSGQQAPQASQTSAAVCVRCRRDPNDEAQYRGTRQGRMRMVREGLICVSCFNREREVVLGRNARNTRPRALVLRDVRLAFIVDQQAAVTKLGAIKDAIEGALTVMRRSQGRALVAWVGGGVVQFIPAPEELHELDSYRSRLQLVLREDS